MKRALMVMVMCGVCIIVGAITAQAQTTYGCAFKSPFGIIWNAVTLDHTYFCLNGTSDCHAIASSGIQSSNTGGTCMWNTYGPTTASERCAARYRGKADAPNSCFIIYGVSGVCHTQTNRGIHAWGKVMDHSQLRGGWLSLAMFGYWGKSADWFACRCQSNTVCGRSCNDR